MQLGHHDQTRREIIGVTNQKIVLERDITSLFSVCVGLHYCSANNIKLGRAANTESQKSLQARTTWRIYYIQFMVGCGCLLRVFFFRIITRKCARSYTRAGPRLETTLCPGRETTLCPRRETARRVVEHQVMAVLAPRQEAVGPLDPALPVSSVIHSSPCLQLK